MLWFDAGIVMEEFTRKKVIMLANGVDNIENSFIIQTIFLSYIGAHFAPTTVT